MLEAQARGYRRTGGPRPWGRWVAVPDRPLRTLNDVETLTMNYVHWCGTERLHSQLNNVTPEEYEQAYYALTTGSPSGDDANKKTA